jgi:hypothetical protein
MDSVILNPAEGWAQLGTQRVSICLVGHDGSLQVNGESGACLTPVSFIERTRLAGYARVSKKPADAIAKLVTEASIQRSGDTDPSVVAILALVLAGANEEGLPSFTESALIVSQYCGWTLEQLAQSNAVEIDRLASQLLSGTDDGWIRLKFDAAEETDLEKIRVGLANNLLLRFQSDHDTLQTTASIEGSLPHTETTMLSVDQDQAAVTLPRSHLDSTKVNIAAIRLPEENAGSSSRHIAEEQVPMRVSSPGSRISQVDNKQYERQSFDLPSIVTGNRPAATSNSSMSPGNTFEVKQSAAAVEVPIQDAYTGSINQHFTVLRHDTNNNANVSAHSVPANPARSAFGPVSTAQLLDDTTAHNTQPNSLLAENIPLQAPISPQQTRQNAADLDDLLDEVAAQLHLEADLRGIDR